MAFKMLWFWLRHPKTAFRLRAIGKAFRTRLNPYEPRNWPRHVRRALWRGTWGRQWRRKVETDES